MRYEFVCTECGEVAEFRVRDPIDGHEQPGDAGRCCGVWRRVWGSFGIVWPAGERGH